VIVEGHCDERGTTEYNLALGQRRAKAVRDALVQQGVDANHLDTVSYGEERPVAMGHDEAAWSQNRRSVLTTK
jgi:peptidoglycan-associated lipoprotein